MPERGKAIYAQGGQAVREGKFGDGSTNLFDQL